MNEVVIVDYLRTPFSKSKPKYPEKDMYNSLRMDDLSALLINKLIERIGFKPDEIDDVLVGCSSQQGENWLYGGRQVIFLAGWPAKIPSMGIERACASSMTGIRIGAMEIMSGYSNIVTVVGFEHMTHVPNGINARPKFRIPNEKLLSDPKYKQYDLKTGFIMGLTAEKLFDEAENISKESMDRWSLRSHVLAAKALGHDYFKGEIFPVKVQLNNGEIGTIDKDLSIRLDTNYEQIAQLPPAFKEGGAITAGNSSPLNSGCSAIVLMSKKEAIKRGLKYMAKIKSMGWSAVNPSVMGKSPVSASKIALQKADLSVKKIDFWEINEAFAIVPLWSIDQLKIDPQKVNIHGGAIAIGHPLGATGARLVGTLSRILHEKHAKYGLAAICVGGGQGEAIILESDEL